MKGSRLKVVILQSTMTTAKGRLGSKIGEWFNDSHRSSSMWDKDVARFSPTTNQC